MDSIHGPATAPHMMPPVQPRQAPDPDAARTSADAPLPSAPPIPADEGRADRADTPVEASGPAAPQGVDPEFWSVLTAEEQEFFSVAHRMGPVTYGPQQSEAPQASLPRGRRLDVRI